MKKSRERAYLIISYLQHICEKRLAALLLFQMREITPPLPPLLPLLLLCMRRRGQEKGNRLGSLPNGLPVCLSACLPVSGLDMSPSLLAEMVAKQLTQIVSFLPTDI
jgi:hypothetical protein